jgi:hypothetical protein
MPEAFRCCQSLWKIKIQGTVLCIRKSQVQGYFNTIFFEFSRLPDIFHEIHRRKLPFFFPLFSKQKGGSDLVMTVGKDINCDLYFFSDNSFDGEIITIDFRLDMHHPVFSIFIKVMNNKNPFYFIFGYIFLLILTY